MATDRPIQATLAYYGAFRWPLTIAELSERLIPSERLECAPMRSDPGTLHDRATALVRAGLVRTAFGLYAPAGADDGMLSGRVIREKEHAQKWRRMRRRAWWLQAVPFVRSLIASGSLALGNTGPDSDWDVFVVTRAGRLYTARACLLFISAVMGRLRTKRDSVAPDKFCFNHYVTTDGMAIRHRSLFIAHALSWMMPIHDPDRYLHRLRQANQWTADYVSGDSGSQFVHREVPYSRSLNMIRRGIELPLNTILGSWLERGLRHWQQRRIENEPATHERGGRVVADDREIEFHPRSAERGVLERYHAALAGMGVRRIEPDSGLTR